jgi:methionyl-tRNA formyltransferase
MRLVFIESVLFSRTVLATLKDMPGIEITGIVTRCSSPHGSDFVSLTDDADTMQAPCLEADDTSTEDLARWIRAKEPDAIFYIGWNRILPADILDIPPRGVIGYHPAALPDNRGRHPIIWALARGLTQTTSTFFSLGRRRRYRRHRGSRARTDWCR